MTAQPPSENVSGRCRDCNYDISDLADDGVCPECGLDVRMSRAPRRIATRGAAYLNRLGLGSVVLSVSNTMLVTLVVLGIAIPTGVPVFSPPTVGLAAVTGWAIARLLGVWLLTAPRGQGAERGGDPGTVRLAHAVFVVAVGTAVVTGMIQRASLLYSIALLAALTLGGLAYIALVRYMRWLARESGDDGLSRQLVSIGSIASLSLLGGAVHYLVIIVLFRSGLAHWAQAYNDAASLITGALVILFAVLLLYEAFSLARWALRTSGMAHGR